MTGNTFCEKLSGESCAVVDEKCFRTQAKKPCEYIGYLKRLTEIAEDTPPIARRVKTDMVMPFLASWKKYNQNPQPGMKRVVASPLEKEIRVVLKSELSSLGVSVSDAGEVFRIWGDSKIVADARAEKEGFPTCIFSFKTWVGGEQIRETFAYAYLAKTWLGQKTSGYMKLGYSGQKLKVKL